jgi:hypothetical protein
VRKSLLARLIGLIFPEIAGATPVVPDNGSMPDQIGLLSALQNINPWPATAFNAASNTTSFTATPAQIMSAQDTVLDLTGTLGGAANLTLPTVATLLASLTPNQAVVGSSVMLRIISETAANAWTVTTNTGWTLNGTMSIAASTWRDFIVTITGTGATPTATLQEVGTGTR